MQTSLPAMRGSTSNHAIRNDVLGGCRAVFHRRPSAIVAALAVTVAVGLGGVYVAAAAIVALGPEAAHQTPGEGGHEDHQQGGHRQQGRAERAAGARG
ncbi:hypothetical protein [Streptomyces sp. NPDC013457]|uniref:hypothetical protein n=1 Tax=Streptomyces sp. NPDC013457 TaxID=3364866 RepID=UPI0036F5BE8F